MKLGGESFEKKLGLEGETLMSEINALINSREISLSLPCEDKVKRQMSKK